MFIFAVLFLMALFVYNMFRKKKKKKKKKKI